MWKTMTNLEKLRFIMDNTTFMEGTNYVTSEKVFECFNDIRKIIMEHDAQNKEMIQAMKDCFIKKEEQ